MEKTAKHKQKASSRGSDYLVKIISVQISICAVIFILALVGMKFGGEGFKGVINEYLRLTEDDISIKDVFKSKAGEAAAPAQEDTTAGEDVVLPLEDNTGEENSSAQAAGQSGGGTAAVNLSDVKIVSSSAILSSLIETEPVIPVQGSSLTSDFGYRKHPITNKYHLHSGTDLGAAEGTVIRAALDGKVTTATYSNARGNYIILEHADGMETYYCHCSKLLVQEGTVVRAGESIALVGSTGDSNGPHLHFEVHINGEAQDAMEVLFKGYEI